MGFGGSDWPKKEAEENKENVRLDQCFSNTSGLPTDLDGWNESVISGGLAYVKVHAEFARSGFEQGALVLQMKHLHSTG